MQKRLEQVKRELEIHDYSPKTVKSYLNGLKKYFFFKGSSFSKLDTENIKDFLLDAKKKGISARSSNLYLNAIKYYYRHVIKINKKIDIRLAKRAKKLPIIFSRNEIRNLIEHITNNKHKLLFALAYAAGLRASEAVSLGVKDLNFDQLTIHLKSAKGKKDRITIFPKKLKINLTSLVAARNKNDFVFPSQLDGRTSLNLYAISSKRKKTSTKLVFLYLSTIWGDVGTYLRVEK